jgi:hypothetical protein
VFARIHHNIAVFIRPVVLKVVNMNNARGLKFAVVVKFVKVVFVSPMPQKIVMRLQIGKILALVEQF